MQIIGLVMGAAIALGLILLLIKLRSERIVKQIWRSLQVEPNNMVFHPEMVAELDEPVRRYFLRAIAPGTVLATYVELKMSGSFRLQADADWLLMQGTEIITQTAGFVWKAKIVDILTRPKSAGILGYWRR